MLVSRIAPIAPSRHRPSGFTLVELLIVIGIVALLISILLPALNKAREQAKQASCLSNLRQIGSAAQMFANEHRMHVPLGGVQYGAGVDGTPAGFHDLYERDYSYYTDKGVERIMPMNAALAPYLGQTGFRTDSASHLQFDMDNAPVRKIFTCPSQAVDGVARMTMISANTGGWTAPSMFCGYGWNQEALGCASGSAIPPDGSKIVGHIRARGQLNRIGHFPADTMYLCDAVPRSSSIFKSGVGDFFTHQPNSSLADCFNNNDAGDQRSFDLNRHNGKINILFFDFHAEKFDIHIDPATKQTTSLTPVYMDYGFPG